MHLVSHCTCEDKLTQTCAFYAFMGCGQQFGWSGTWKGYEWEVGDKEIYLTKVCGGSFVDRPLWAKIEGICVLCEWSLQE